MTDALGRMSGLLQTLIPLLLVGFALSLAVLHTVAVFMLRERAIHDLRVEAIRLREEYIERLRRRNAEIAGEDADEEPAFVVGSSLDDAQALDPAEPQRRAA